MDFYWEGVEEEFYKKNQQKTSKRNNIRVKKPPNKRNRREKIPRNANIKNIPWCQKIGETGRESKQSSTKKK